jgi:lysozyme
MNLREQLIRDEEEVLHVYLDSRGYQTIGVGRLVDKRKGGGITHEEAMYLLENDIRKREIELQTKLPWTNQLDYERWCVLVNMSFNMGVAGLLGFKKMLAAMKRGDWEDAAVEIMDSDYATELPKRAARMAKQMLCGVMQ